MKNKICKLNHCFPASILINIVIDQLREIEKYFTVSQSYIIEKWVKLAQN